MQKYYGDCEIMGFDSMFLGQAKALETFEEVWPDPRDPEKSIVIQYIEPKPGERTYTQYGFYDAAGKLTAIMPSSQMRRHPLVLEMLPKEHLEKIGLKQPEHSSLGPLPESVWRKARIEAGIMKPGLQDLIIPGLLAAGTLFLLMQ